MRKTMIFLKCTAAMAMLAGIIFVSYAQEGTSQDVGLSDEAAFNYKEEGKIGVGREVIFESLPDKEKEELVKLRQTDPEKFKKVVKERLKARWEYLKKLRKEDPEKFKEVMKTARQRIRSRLEELRKKDPEKFKQIMEKHRERVRRRLEKLRKEDPEKFRKVIARRRQMAQRRLRKLCEKDPDKCAAVKQKIQKRWDEFKTKHPKQYDRLKQRGEKGRNVKWGIGAGRGIK